MTTLPTFCLMSWTTATATTTSTCRDRGVCAVRACERQPGGCAAVCTGDAMFCIMAPAHVCVCV
jgi:hypothetical protein